MKRLKVMLFFILLSMSFHIINCLSIIEIRANELISAKEDDDFVIKDGILTKYKGEGGDVVIPEGITAIGPHVFSNNKKITSVTLPHTVSSIGASAFRGCENLKIVKMSDSVSSIGYMAFWNCKNLSEISTLDGVTTIGSSAFDLTPWIENKRAENPLVIINGNLIDGRNCTGDVVIPDSVNTIVGEAFGFNKEITSVIIPDSVISIEADAFVYCSSLVNVRMGNSITSIGEEAFASCKNLKEVTLSKALTSIEDQTFQNCKKLEKITIPDNVTTIGISSFRDCKNLKYVTIIGNVNKVKDYAFTGCNKALTIYSVNNSYMQSYAKKNNINFKKLAISSSSITLSVGKSKTLKLNSLAECSWKSSNKSVVSVNQSGKITAKKKGTATITAYCYGKNFNCKVTVK